MRGKKQRGEVRWLIQGRESVLGVSRKSRERISNIIVTETRI